MNIIDLKKRTLSGIVYISLIIWALISSLLLPYHIIFSVFAFIGVWEYSRLVKNNVTRPFRTILDCFAAVYLFLYISFRVIKPQSIGFSLFAPYLFYILYVVIRSIYSEKDGLPNSIGKTIFGQLYVGGSLSMANMLIVSDQIQFNKVLLLMIFCCIWASDTGAYLVGSTIGKRRLFPSISPKKSWEGFIGGIVFSIVTALIFGVYGGVSSIIYTNYSLIIIGLVISVAATWGDLFESSMKRNANVKDSGRFIPGHGGLLDRIDSLLFALPIGVLFIYMVIESSFNK